MSPTQSTEALVNLYLECEIPLFTAHIGVVCVCAVDCYTYIAKYLFTVVVCGVPSTQFLSSISNIACSGVGTMGAPDVGTPL